MSDNDWFDSPNWHDANEAIDPGGAAAGPGAIGPVPAQLISNTGTGDWHWELGDDGLMNYVQDIEDPAAPPRPRRGNRGPGPGQQHHHRRRPRRHPGRCLRSAVPGQLLGVGEVRPGARPQR